MDDLKKALLGDHEASKRLSDAGVLVPSMENRRAARLAWNTRAPILSAEEMEMLEGMEHGN